MINDGIMHYLERKLKTDEKDASHMSEDTGNSETQLSLVCTGTTGSFRTAQAQTFLPFQCSGYVEEIYFPKCLHMSLSQQISELVLKFTSNVGVAQE